MTLNEISPEAEETEVYPTNARLKQKAKETVQAAKPGATISLFGFGGGKKEGNGSK